MGHYKANVRDLEFNLFEVLDLGSVLGNFDLDEDTARSMLAEAARLAEGPVAESFADADRNPPTFDPDSHSVTLPEPFKQAVRAWQAAGWHKIGLAEEVGGIPAPAPSGRGPRAFQRRTLAFVSGVTPAASLSFSRAS